MATLVYKRGDNSEYYTINEMVCCKLNNGEEARFEIDPDNYLGQGGNALVYKCIDSVTSEPYAIKIQIVDDDKRKERFKREVQLLEVIHHEQLMVSVASGQVEMKNRNIKNKYPFAIMPLADQNLEHVMKKSSKPLPFERLAGQYRGLSEALAVLHTKAIHRDIKPQNILVRGDTWILADYGLCKFLDNSLPEVTRAHEKMGPTYWMSPESMNRVIGNNDEITKASDVFQLAAVFWFAATKRHPTGIVTENDWRGPHAIFEVLASALSHDPQSRPQDGREFHERIEKAIF